MNKQIRSIKRVKHDTIKKLDFNDKDVLSQEVDQRKRLIDLRKATTTNRATPRRVNIIFESSDGFMMVETDELRLNNKYVSVKKGCFLPLRSIYATKELI